jgi:hypothetical protein
MSTTVRFYINDGTAFIAEKGTRIRLERNTAAGMVL